MGLSKQLICSVFLFVLSVIAINIPAYAGEAMSLVVPVTRSEVITLPSSMSKVVIADRKVAGVVKHSGNKVSITGNGMGVTDIRFYGSNGRIITQVNVRVSHDLPSIKQTLHTFFPNENIGVELLNDAIALRGSVSDAEVAAKAVSLVKEFLRSASYTDKGSEHAVVNLLNVRSGQQVMLRVRVGEIQRTALKKVGLSLQGMRNAGNVSMPFATGGGIGNAIGTVTSDANIFGVGSIIYDSANLDLSATLDLLEQDGLFKVLAEPNLVSISGEAAEFFAGGEFPVPTPQDNNAISAEFKKFGVQVEFTPLVMAQNRIRLVVEPEVSELSTDGAISFSGYSIPSVSSRRAKTTVELAPGESFMIAGLIKDEMSTSINQLPGLGSIPILSALFRSTAFQRKETELVIAVTPYLVDPVASTEISLPTDNFREPTMLESIFVGALGYANNMPIDQKGLEGEVGFILE